MRGESDLDAVMRAIADKRLARVIACAPGTHPLVRVVAALCGDLTGLLDAQTRADPALHGALVRLIGMPAGGTALRAWAEVAPAGWGRDYAAAALIGPDDESAGLLRDPDDAAFAIRCWGRSAPAAPTAWAEALAPAERDRRIATVRRDSFSGASCLPWLPPDVVNQTLLNDADLFAALDAFAAASPTVRALHAGIVQGLVDHAHPVHLGELTRLACVMQDDDIWRRVQMLVRKNSGSAIDVVAVAPWDALTDDVRAVILEYADESDVCAAVAAARGRRDPGAIAITNETAVAFFAALAPRVWDAFDAGSQRRWLHALWVGDAHLAVRALGLRPEILARAPLTDSMVRAMQRHPRDAATQRTP